MPLPKHVLLGIWNRLDCLARINLNTGLEMARWTKESNVFTLNKLRNSCTIQSLNKYMRGAERRSGAKIIYNKYNPPSYEMSMWRPTPPNENLPPYFYWKEFYFHEITIIIMGMAVNGQMSLYRLVVIYGDNTHDRSWFAYQPSTKKMSSEGKKMRNLPQPGQTNMRNLRNDINRKWPYWKYFNNKKEYHWISCHVCKWYPSMLMNSAPKAPKAPALIQVHESHWRCTKCCPEILEEIDPDSNMPAIATIYNYEWHLIGMFQRNGLIDLEEDMKRHPYKDICKKLYKYFIPWEDIPDWPFYLKKYKK